MQDVIQDKNLINKKTDMKNKFYFKNEDAELCYSKEHFIEGMEDEGITEMEVLEANPDSKSDYFWCKEHGFCGDDTRETCGSECKEYAPRNGKSGCCKHHTKKLYFHGEKVILTNQ